MQLIAEIDNGQWTTYLYSDYTGRAVNKLNNEVIDFPWKIIDGILYGYDKGVWKKGRITEAKVKAAMAVYQFDQDLEELLK
jgi:hypothetical protein